MSATAAVSQDHARPTLTMIGELPLITPQPIDTLRPHVLRRVEAIEAAVAARQISHASKLALALEADLGVTNADRLAALEPTEAWEAELEAAMRPGLNPEKPQATGPKTELLESERGFDPAQVARYDKARDMLSQTRIKLTDQQREGYARIIAKIEANRMAWLEKTWQEAASSETASLARARGEDVETGGSGNLRIVSRDPLISAARHGHLTAEQYDLAVTIRDLYEARRAGLGSQMGGIGSASSPTYDNSPTVFYGVQRGKALQRLGRIEIAVALNCRLENGQIDVNGLTMLRAVCGHGKSLSSQGEGRALERNAASLARALDVAAGLS